MSYFRELPNISYVSLLKDRNKNGKDLPAARKKNRRVSIEISGTDSLDNLTKSLN